MRELHHDILNPPIQAEVRCIGRWRQKQRHRFRQIPNAFATLLEQPVGDASSFRTPLLQVTAQNEPFQPATAQKKQSPSAVRRIDRDRNDDVHGRLITLARAA